MVAVDRLREQGEKVGVLTLTMLRPFPGEDIYNQLKDAKKIVIADRQDSYGAIGGNLSIEIRAALQKYGKKQNSESPMLQNRKIL